MTIRSFGAHGGMKPPHPADKSLGMFPRFAMSDRAPWPRQPHYVAVSMP
jgi:hypothetical protein